MKERMALGAFLALLIFASGFAHGKANAAYADTPGYEGIRWRSTSVCVYNQIDDPVIRQTVYRAVQNVDETTSLRVINKGKSTCSGYAQVVNVVDANYAESWMAKTTWPQGLTWGVTKTGLSTWFFNSGVTIKFNSRLRPKYPNVSTWKHVAIHELAHAIGLGHRDDTCNSVVSERPLSTCGSRPLALTSVDRRTVETIYSW